MTNMPEFDLNEPFTLLPEYTGITEMQDALNQMWRNGCINDTYEPGSTFKIITASAGLEEGVVTLDDTFSCPGYHASWRTGESAAIRSAVTERKPFCRRPGIPAIRFFIDVGLRLGVDRYFSYFHQFGLSKKTGIDLPGEAATIMHKENVGQVELATISFRQSFQITPVQLIATVGSLINGGTRVTPRTLGCRRAMPPVRSHRFSYPDEERIVSGADVSDRKARA
ncbi:MAG: penicillin-binding transpeptidase domain-containing protein [Lachnospiraceae bacterium]